MDGVEIVEDLSLSDVVLMSQQKQKNGGDIFWGETLGSAVLNSGASAPFVEQNGINVFLKH